MRLPTVQVLLITFSWFTPVLLSSQNLVPNPSFEEYSNCPTSFGNGEELDCDPWFNGNAATADYYNICATSWICDVPNNYQGTQDPVTGVGYTGIITKIGPPPTYWFEYVEAELNSTLVFGKAYKISFYVNCGVRGCALQHLGAHLSIGPLESLSPGYLPVTPQIESNQGWLNDTLNWMLIEGCFVAQGGEDHITIGNFRSYENTPLEPCDAPFPNTSYYFIDNVSVEEVPLTGLDLDLGDDVITCYEYTITPEVDGDVQYFWSDGSTGSELTVTASGEYQLTVIDNQCRGAVDSIEVEITNQPPVELNPEDTLICSDESLTFSLNPSAGDYEWNDGSTDSEYIISTAGIYSVTLDDGCDLTSDEIEVSVLEPPVEFNLGNDTILCQGTEIEIEFDPALGDFMWQDGTTTPYIIIFEEGTYALTISNMCGESSATVQVEELIPVNVNIGPQQDILCDFESFDIFLDDTYATFLWQDGSTEAEYQISSAGTYIVTMTHVCGPSVDSMIVLQLDIPQVTLGDSIFACPGEEVILTSTGNVGNYSWQDGSSNDSLNVSGPGLYSLTIENPCGMDSDTILVEYGELLSPVQFGPDVSLCPGEQLTLSGGNPGATHLWQDGSVADTFVVQAAGDYHVVVSNECFTYSDTIHVVVGNTPPVANLAKQFVLCEGATTVLDPGVSGVEYLWNDGTTASTLVISNPGTYSVTVSNACGNDADTIVVMNGGPLPAVDLGADISLCPGDTLSVQPSFQNVDNWTWHDGSVSPAFQITDAGVISIDVTNSCGTSADTLFVQLLAPAPVLDLGVDTSLCAGESTTLTITLLNVGILWNDGSTNTSLVVDEPGLYYATVNNSCGSDTDTFQLFQLPGIPALDLGPDLPLCPGETIVLAPGIQDVDYVWQNGSTDTFFLATVAQTIVLNISNACGTSQDFLDIYISTDGPDVSLGPDLLACEGEEVTIAANISGVTYAWQDGSTASTFIAVVSGVYAVTVNNSCGTDADTIVVDIHGLSPDPDIGADTLLCVGEELTLISNADLETSTTWQDGSGLTTFEVNAPGTYWLHQQNRCGEVSDTIVVSYLALPVEIDLGPDTTLCIGEQLILVGPATTDDYQWQDGSMTSTYLVENSGAYTLSIQNECGVSKDSISVNFDEQIPVFPTDKSFIICPGESVTLDVAQSFPVEYSWDIPSDQPSITVTSPGAYSITIITDCAEHSDTYTVEVLEDCAVNDGLFIPNVFSPNGDQVNDVFGVFPSTDVEVLSLRGTIFDRWGNVVYQSDAIPFIWDGRFGDEDILPGVYVYLIKIEYKAGENTAEKNFKGDVTVMK